MMTIVQKENPILRKIARDVLIAEIISPKIRKIIAAMKKSLGAEGDGVAIAAPQIAVPLRIFVVSGRIFNPDLKKSDFEKPQKSDFGPAADLIFINPKITKLSKKKAYLPEGCLSVRWLYGEVKRSTNATVEAYDESGKKFTRGAGGLLAQIFQHEVDHLDGVLFIDKARKLVELPPPKSRHEK